jgi:hypothetical protein
VNVRQSDGSGSADGGPDDAGDAGPGDAGDVGPGDAGASAGTVLGGAAVLLLGGGLASADEVAGGPAGEPQASSSAERKVVAVSVTAGLLAPI